MMKRIDNIVIGDLIEGMTLDILGVRDNEVTIHITENEARDMNFFLPKLLVSAGVFKSTSEIKQIQKQRDEMKHLHNRERTIWRQLTSPELTQFKIGKKSFWLIVGEFSS